ncbi:MAG: hypothetical protein H7A23_01585 [Leptospiraceae bacterium]|nr:hypothetical protein [Leptospiraceae bacterium]
MILWEVFGSYGRGFGDWLYAGENYLYAYPFEHEGLYQLSVAYKKVGKNHKAANLGECLYLRNKYHIPNLLHLSSIYSEEGITGRAKMMSELAKQCS